MNSLFDQTEDQPSEFSAKSMGRSMGFADEEQTPAFARKKNELTVNEYLESLNATLLGEGGRIIGEISQLTIVQNKYLFFSLKDKETDSVLRCFMSWYAYRVCGVDFEEGLEIVVTGHPQIYKPRGDLSFQVKSAELVGEGALKKAYDKLKAKLTSEGVFDEARKKPLPLFPQKIGLITSKSGAAIGDFLTNLGNFGFKITMIDSRVEGQAATKELLDSIVSLKDKDIDVLVIIRGGGSLESFLPFNNERLVREIVDYPVPVLVGIGHDRDVPLLCLAADMTASTPTATAQALNWSWQQASARVDIYKEKIMSSYHRTLNENETRVTRSFTLMKDRFQSIFDQFEDAENGLKRSLASIRSRIGETQRLVMEYPAVIDHRMRSLMTTAHNQLSGILQSTMLKMEYAISDANTVADFGRTMKGFAKSIEQGKQTIESQEKLLNVHDPTTILKRGYTIAHLNGKVIKQINQVKKGETVRVRVKDGSFDSEITNVSTSAA